MCIGFELTCVDAYARAVDVASGLNIAAFNVGIAIGSVIGGFTVEHMGLRHTPWIGALIVLLALVLTFVSEQLERRTPQLAV